MLFFVFYLIFIVFVLKNAIVLYGESKIADKERSLLDFLQ